jgi:t-SNARE complex subunit (syntaxin)
MVTCNKTECTRINYSVEEQRKKLIKQIEIKGANKIRVLEKENLAKARDIQIRLQQLVSLKEKKEEALKAVHARKGELQKIEDAKSAQNKLIADIDESIAKMKENVEKLTEEKNSLLSELESVDKEILSAVKIFKQQSCEIDNQIDIYRAQYSDTSSMSSQNSMESVDAIIKNIYEAMKDTETTNSSIDILNIIDKMSNSELEEASLVV